MKRVNLFVKASTLLLFISLIAGFLLYRTGKLDNWFDPGQDPLQGSPNGGAISSSKKDTIPTPYTDSLRKLRMSSSKSAILTEPRTYDTALLRKAIEEQSRIAPPPNKEMMSSSKSLIIVRPKDYSKFDTTKQDIKQLKRRNN